MTVVAADFARNMLRQGAPKVAMQGDRVALHAADGHALPYRDATFDGRQQAIAHTRHREGQIGDEARIADTRELDHEIGVELLR